MIINSYSVLSMMAVNIPSFKNYTLLLLQKQIDTPHTEADTPLT